MAHGQALAALTTATGKDLLAFLGFASRAISVLAKTPAPFELIEHCRHRVLIHVAKDKSNSTLTMGGWKDLFAHYNRSP
jgi:hypothetical protein